MIRIGVVSDTHLPRFGQELPIMLVEGLNAAGVSLILHAGDHTAAFVVDQLARIAPVEAVAGNNDSPDLLERFGDRRIIEISSRRIGLTHGHLGTARTSPGRAESTFERGTVDIVVFGHSHQPLWTPADGRRPALLNPGSPTDRRREAQCSYAILELGRAGLDARIERFGAVRPRPS
jgi:putative phosphoesterase